MLTIKNAINGTSKNIGVIKQIYLLATIFQWNASPVVSIMPNNMNTSFEHSNNLILSMFVNIFNYFEKFAVLTRLQRYNEYVEVFFNRFLYAQLFIQPVKLLVLYVAFLKQKCWKEKCWREEAKHILSTWCMQYNLQGFFLCVFLFFYCYGTLKTVRH